MIGRDQYVDAIHVRPDPTSDARAFCIAQSEPLGIPDHRSRQRALGAAGIVMLAGVARLALGSDLPDLQHLCTETEDIDRHVPPW